MKILMLCEFYNEAMDYQEPLLAKYLKRLGHDVAVITGATTSVHDYMGGRSRAASARCEMGEHARIYRVPERARFLKRIIVYASIREIVEKEQPDLLFFHDIIPNMLEARDYLRRRPEVCAIMDYHADYSNSGASRLSRLLLHRLSRRLVFKAIRARMSAILPIVPGSQQFLEDLYGVKKHETEIFPLGVDTQEVAAVRGSDARGAVRAELNIPDDALVVFTGGKLVPLKRTAEVLSAVTALDDPSVHVVVVGAVKDDPAYEEELRSAAGPTAHFVGWQDSRGVYRHQAAADVAVFPASQSVLWQQSVGMGLPLVVGEYIGPGRPRQDVGYMNWGNIHVLRPDADAVAQIAAFLRAARTDRTILREMARKAEKVTAELLSYDRLARRTIEIANTHRLRVGAVPLAVDGGASPGQPGARGAGGNNEALAT
jgi:1,2-diacylglycerol 3-alpha-glucosyltransferase